MSDLLRQQLIEMTQATDAYHAEIVAELRAEVKRLRTNVNEMQMYAERQAANSVTFANVNEWHFGKLLAYQDMAARAIIAYGKVAD